MNNLSGEIVIGIDIGGTYTKYGFVNSNGEISGSGEFRTGTFVTIESFIDFLYEVLQPSTNNISTENEIIGIGIGAPNGNFYTGRIEHAPNLPWKGIINLREMIAARFNLPVSLTNDANGAAVGEMLYGAARGMQDFILLSFGTGVGSGIVINGKLVLGFDGFAGELGHVTVIPDARIHPHTGMKGTFESYACSNGIIETAKELLFDKKKESTLRGIPPDTITSKIIYEAAIKGDKVAREVYVFTGEIIGKAIADIVMFSSPEAIIFFGGVMNAWDILFPVIRINMEKNLLPVFKNRVKLLRSFLPESNAAILGAAALIQHKIK